MPPARQGVYLLSFVESRLRGPAGAPVRLALTGVDGAERTVEVRLGPTSGVWSEPIGNYPPQLVEVTAERGRDGIAYLKFNVFLASVMGTVRPFLLGLKPGDGLVIDLRGNPGGVTAMASGISGWLSAREFSLGRTRFRSGFQNLVVNPQDGAFSGPVAVLLDRGSASTSEIFAAGLQEAGRVRVFGELSAGAALPSAFKNLPNGDVLQYAVGDLVTPRGRRLEGIGVRPDESVTASREDWAAGRDPVLAAARAWLEQERKRHPARSTVGGEKK
jgi:carboxyl-terminal processing protease